MDQAQRLFNLAAALKVSERNKVVCFIDDIPALMGRTIWDIPIKSEMVLNYPKKIEQILLANPSLNKSKEDPLSKGSRK